MCGISVIVNKSKEPVSLVELNSMNERIVHRGPDDSGTFLKNNWGFGFRRLSILDLSLAGHQPMIDDQGNVIIFNGEIFNYIELRSELEKSGIQFKSQTDTEVILAAYKIWGRSCVVRFNGMWGFVLYDVKKNLFFISRDRFGIKPLYYWNTQGRLAVGSEIKQFGALEGFSPKINEESALRFLVKRQLNVSEETMFKDVLELKPGHNLLYDLNTNHLTKECYYDPRNTIINHDLSFTQAVDQFGALFENAVNIRLRSDVKVGACLSGGLDSSSIVSVAAKSPSESFSATTISNCYHEKLYDEQEYIDEVVKKIHFRSIKTFPEIDDLFEKQILEKIIYHQDQPIRSASHFSEYAVFEAAKRHGLIVMLDGQGSDEFLAGYKPFKFYNYSLAKSLSFYKLINELRCQVNNHYSFLGLLMLNIKHFLKSSPANLFIEERSIPRWIDRQYYREHISAKEFDGTTPKSYRENSLEEIRFTSIPYQLHSEDRNSMMHSVESRLPFLDFDLADFMLTIPDEFKLGKGTTKLILREAMKPILPGKIVNRHSKMGFEAPEESFVRRNKKVIENYLIEFVDSSNHFISQNIMDDYQKMVEGKLPYDNCFFRMVSYQIWINQFNTVY